MIPGGLRRADADPGGYLRGIRSARHILMLRCFPISGRESVYWVAGTPYPFGNSKFENPSIYHGHISTELRVPTGVTNPLATAPSGAYMSDPDVVHDPDTDELRLYYRETIEGLDEVLLVTSRDGVHWTPPQLVASAARYSLISPAVVRESATSWRMWTVNASAQGWFSLEREMTLQQRRSPDGVTWGDPVLVTLRIPGRVPWHWDVQYIAAKSEYWALIAAYPRDDVLSDRGVFRPQRRRHEVEGGADGAARTRRLRADARRRVPVVVPLSRRERCGVGLVLGRATRRQRLQVRRGIGTLSVSRADAPSGGRFADHARAGGIERTLARAASGSFAIRARLSPERRGALPVRSAQPPTTRSGLGPCTTGR